MELSARERASSRRLLGLLDTADLFSLAGTVTKKKSTVCTRAEAIDAIVQNSHSAYELLNRKKVLRNVIAAHLKNEGIPLAPNFTKNEVIQKTLTHWSNHEINPARIFTQVKHPVTSPSIIKPDRISNVSHQQGQVASNVPLCLIPADISKLSIHSSEREENKEQRSSSQTYNPPEIIPSMIFTPVKHPVTLPSLIKPDTVSNVSLRQQEKVLNNIPLCLLSADISKLSIHSSQREERKEQRSPSQTCEHPQYNKNVFQPPTVHPSATHKISANEVVTSPFTASKVYTQTSCIWPVDCEKFTCDFCKWFYTLLNSQHETSRLRKGDWGPQHFMENAELQLMYMSAQRQYNGGRSASTRLLALVQEDKLSFQPNLTSKGIKCERSPKGMVMMMVSGSVFMNNSFLGTFDQIFQVVWNSTNNKWKIQFIDLNIQKSS
ncbi:uncharacterized protein ACNLHF_009544 isoform 1-T1 [Anomaloglossus baeobatrachus]|uniref:uncharacterized protein LOC142283171 isoform X1 n=1 Tax=Anomaloglossus baeobatrachus TaxID=238106 RepID=UPI003F506839